MCFVSSFGFAYTGNCFLTYISASTANALFQYPENTPHTGLYVPFQAARAVEVVTRLCGTVLQFHIVGVSNADGTLERNGVGVWVIRLFFPGMSVDTEACISRLISRHHSPEYDTVPGICFEHRSCRISVYAAVKYFCNLGMAL